MKKFFSALLLILLFASSAFACCDDPVVVDMDDALRRSQRKGRDPIEGFWGVRLDWHPEADSARSYRVAIVRNTYDVYEDADYLGVSTCFSPGCVKGEVKMFLYRTNRPNEFDAVMVTSVGYGKGRATLGPDGEGRGNASLDMRAVLFGDRRMTQRLVRIRGK